MKKLKEKNLTKKIIYIIILLMLCNFIIPNYSYAVSVGEGGSFLQGIAQFLCYIPDAIIWALQNMFVSIDGIETNEGEYKIMYSPGIIFSGKVPAFDINFISPNTEADFGVENWLEVNRDIFIENVAQKEKDEYDTKLEEVKNYTCISYEEEEQTKYYTYYKIEDDTLYVCFFIEVLDYTVDDEGNWVRVPVSCWYYQNEYELTEQFLKETNTAQYASTEYILQNTIATWYNALSRIALVGLLSVLVYIGIKIVLSSASAKDKAKYKKMLKDWLVALCILFTLHYVMSITVTVVDKVNEIIKASTIGPTGEDILMSSVRNEIANGDDWASVIVYVIIYDALAVYTIIFTIQYIRRAIYIAFLTAIAPLITLTYPLDKIKDSKSQAFDMWLKDYVFFALLQVLHLLIYYIFLGSAIDLNNQGNWFFALVAIGFLTQAEKIMKKMFGFEQSKSMGVLAAGATGALVMNAFNKLPKASKTKTSGGKDGSSQGTPKGVRTATTKPLTALTRQSIGTLTDDSDSSNTPQNGSPRNNTMPEGDTPPNNGQGNTNTPAGGTQPNNGGGNNTNQTGDAAHRHGNIDPNITRLNRNNRQKPDIIGGVTTVLGRSTLSLSKTTLKLLAEGSIGILGFSAALTKDGDISDAVAGLIGGVAAGNALVENTAQGVRKLKDKIPEKLYELVDTAREGAFGEEYAQNKKFDREFRKSSAYRQLKRNSEFTDIEFDRKIQQMLDAGITDSKRMEKILKNHKKHPRKYSMEKSIAYSELAQMCPESILYNDTNFIRFCKDKDIEFAEEELRNLRKYIVDFK